MADISKITLNNTTYNIKPSIQDYTAHYMNSRTGTVSGNNITYYDYRSPGNYKTETKTDGNHTGTINDPYTSVDWCFDRGFNKGSCDLRINITTPGYYIINRAVLSNVSLHVASSASATVYLLFAYTADRAANWYESHINIDGGTNKIVIDYLDVQKGSSANTNHSYIYGEGGTIWIQNVTFASGFLTIGTSGLFRNCSFTYLEAIQASRLYLEGCSVGGSSLYNDTNTIPLIISSNSQITLADYNGSGLSIKTKGSMYTKAILVNDSALVQKTENLTVPTTVANAGLIATNSIIISSTQALDSEDAVGTGNSLVNCIQPPPQTINFVNTRVVGGLYSNRTGVAFTIPVYGKPKTATLNLTKLILRGNSTTQTIISGSTDIPLTSTGGIGEGYCSFNYKPSDTINTNFGTYDNVTCLLTGVLALTY